MSVAGITPWYRENEADNRVRTAALTYLRAVREGVGIEAARAALTAAMDADEAAHVHA